jgi:hypothetical protein
MSVWLEIPRCCLDGQLCDRLSKFRWNSSLNWATFCRCCPVIRTVARNFHIKAWRVRTKTSVVQTKKTVVRMSEFWMHDLPYEWAHPYGNPHRPNGCSCLPIFSFLERNLIADRTLSGIRTCCWNVRTDASWNSSKLLDIGEGSNEKLLSSRWMMLGQLSVRTNVTNPISLTWNLCRIF